MSGRRLKILLAGAVLLTAAISGLPWAVEEWRYRALLADRALIAGDRDASVKPRMTCPDPAEALVFVTFGQSNAANHGSARLRAPSGVFDFYAGECYAGDDPQYLATSNGGSPWPVFAETLRAAGEARPILIASIAVGNTRIDQWVSGTDHGEKLNRITASLIEQGYEIDAFLFMQGESDQETPSAAYRDGLIDIADTVERASPGTPLLLSQTSVCGIERGRFETLNAARRAVAERKAVHIGPDTDSLGQPYRSDGCHFNEPGLKALGALWGESVMPFLDYSEARSR